MNTPDLHTDGGGWWHLPGMPDIKVRVEELDQYGDRWALWVVANHWTQVDTVRLREAEDRARFIKGLKSKKLGSYSGKISTLLDALAALSTTELRSRVRDSETHGGTLNVVPVPWPKLLTSNISGIQWTVDKLIPKGRLSFLTGPPNSGKTWFAYEMARCVGTRKPHFLREFAVTPGRALVIQEDDPPASVKERFTALTKEDPPASVQVDFLNKCGIRADVQDHWNQVIQLVEKNGYELVIIDALNNVHRREENEASDMKPVLDALEELANSGPAVVVIHHDRKGTGKSYDQMRGSSLIQGRAEAVIRVEESAPDGSKISISKMKSAPRMPSFRVVRKRIGERIVLRHDGLSESAASKEDLARSKIVELLREVTESEALKTKQIVAHFDKKIGQKSVREALCTLRETGEVSHAGTSHGGYRYWGKAQDSEAAA